MKMKEECLPCLINQIVKVADITKAEDRDTLYRKVFTYLGGMDFSRSNPEVIGETFSILKKHIGNEDPYYEIRKYYNDLIMQMEGIFEKEVQDSVDPFFTSLRYAVIGNIIDMNPFHNRTEEEIMEYVRQSDKYEFAADDSERLKKELKHAKSLLYLGDNCGEICFDKLFIKEIKKRNPSLTVYFGVRGEPVINDSIEADAYYVGMDEYAEIVSNEDNSLGTVLGRTGKRFQQIFADAGVVIAKGQANYESLSEISDKQIYFLLMTKCKMIADDIGLPEMSLVCTGRGRTA